MTGGRLADRVGRRGAIIPAVAVSLTALVIGRPRSAGRGTDIRLTLSAAEGC